MTYPIFYEYIIFYEIRHPLLVSLHFVPSGT
jgi:hypothetical protein